MSTTIFEGRLNVLVGYLLSKKLGVHASSETIERRGRIDVVVYSYGLKIALEGSYQKVDAERDASKRVEKGLADAAIALHYIEEYPLHLTDAELQELLENSEFEAMIIVPEDVSNVLDRYLIGRKIVAKSVTEWTRITLPDLAGILNEVIQYIICEEDVRESLANIESQINDFVSSLKNYDRLLNVAKKLYDSFYKLYGLSVGDYKEIAELLYAKTALTLLLSSAFYQSIHAIHGLDSLTFYVSKYGARNGLRRAFDAILTIDYRPIYELAVELIDNIPDVMMNRLEKIIDLAVEISSKRTLLKKDFSGKVYHKIVGDWSIRKGFATYFTSIPAASLLSYLSIFTKNNAFEESILQDVKRIKVCDFACGSGTLLTTTYSALQDFVLRLCIKSGVEFDPHSFHKFLLEDIIWGFDALRYAIQIASTNLALQNPVTPVRTMNMFSVPLGIKNNDVILGSLAFLGTKELVTLLPWAHELALEHTTLFGESVESPKEIPTHFNLIIMNPPFTRATGRGGKKGGGLFGFILEKEARERVVKSYNKLRDEVRNILRPIGKKYSRLDLNEFYNIGQAGEGLLFLYLASKYVSDEGRIAFVLPKSLLSGASWFLARTLLLEKFQLEYIVLSYDSENGYNFSESTSLSESLIIARRTENNGGETTFVLLLRKPKTSLEARALAFKIIDVIDKEDGRQRFHYVNINNSEAFIYKVKRKELLENVDNWIKLAAFPDPYLTLQIQDIFMGKLADTVKGNIPIKRLEEIAMIGIDAHQFHDHFKKVKSLSSKTYPCIYGGGEEVREHILINPNALILAKDEKGVELFNLFSSNLLVPDRIWVDTAHVIALYSNEPVLSNIFYAVKLKKKHEPKTLKALALWLNTTWGLLTVLANRSETRGRWIRLKMTHWRIQPVLDVASLDDNVLERLSGVFNRFCRRELRRLPYQFDIENPDPMRRELDVSFLNALGLEPDEKSLNELYDSIHKSLLKWIK
ncbi:MAG: hypothetical protein N3G77_01125 [Nitrososphaeria archaeon]|nr:hypothetical protein [Nitrososphaeria archaeon]